MLFLSIVGVLMIVVSSRSEPLCVNDAEELFSDLKTSLLNVKIELREMEDEMLFIRNSSTSKIEELQRTLLEFETRNNTEITRITKKYETDIRELYGELQVARQVIDDYEQEFSALNYIAKELEVVLERRDVEDLKIQLLVAERVRKNVENELAETSDRLSETQMQVTALTSDKHRMEAYITTMQSDLDDALSSQRAAEERADRLEMENMSN